MYNVNEDLSHRLSCDIDVFLDCSTHRSHIALVKNNFPICKSSMCDRAGSPYRQNRQMSRAPRPRGPRGTCRGTFKAQLSFVSSWKNNEN